MKMKTFDPACYDLAVLFLDDDKTDTEERRRELALWIQQAIEDFFSVDWKSEPDPVPPLDPAADQTLELDDGTTMTVTFRTVQ